MVTEKDFLTLLNHLNKIHIPYVQSKISHKKGLRQGCGHILDLIFLLGCRTVEPIVSLLQRHNFVGTVWCMFLHPDFGIDIPSDL